MKFSKSVEVPIRGPLLESGRSFGRSFARYSETSAALEVTRWSVLCTILEWVQVDAGANLEMD